MKKFYFKRSILMLIIVFLTYPALQAQVYNGSINLYSQADVDAFNYSSVTGDLRISGADITDLSPLSGLTTVGAYLFIYSNSTLTQLDGLSSLTSVGHLYIMSNNALTQLDGLSSLTSVGGTLYIISNGALTQLDGLSSLTSIGGPSYIQFNGALTQIDGLASLTSVAHLYIVSNGTLTQLDGLSSLTSVGNTLYISSNAALTQLDGLASLTSVGYTLDISSNGALTQIDGLSSLTSVGNTLYISSNGALTQIDGLASLTSVGGMAIYSNGALTQLDGLSSLTSVGTLLFIGYNSALTQLDGLSALTSVGDYLNISSNAALTQLDGLSSLTSVGNLNIVNNGALTQLDGLSSLTSVGDYFNISSNATLTQIDGLSSLASVGGNLEINDNTLQSEYCGLFLLLNGGGLTGSYTVTGNAQNPTQQEIIDGGPCNSPPIAICQNVSVSADDNCQAYVTAAQVDNGSFDPDGDEITLSLSPEGPYPEYETTTVTLTVTDEFGLTDECTAIITVVDETPPIITVITNPITHWPPNHKYETINVGQLIVSISDNCSELTVDNVYISSVSCDEEEDAPGNGDGNTINDIVISDFCDAVDLRKERSGKGNGRVYTIYFEVLDDAGNIGTASCQVHVPKNNGGTVIDDGMAYEVTCSSKSSFVADNGNVELTAYPNPFRGLTTISFVNPESKMTTLKVYNSMGLEVATLFEGIVEAGHDYKFNFDGYALTQGVYIVHLQSGNEVSILKKIILAK